MAFVLSSYPSLMGYIENLRISISPKYYFYDILRYSLYPRQRGRRKFLTMVLFVLLPISDGIYRKSENINIPKILFLGYSQIFFISASSAIGGSSLQWFCLSSYPSPMGYIENLRISKNIIFSKFRKLLTLRRDPA